MRKTLLATVLLVATLLLEVAFVYHYIVPREHYIFDFAQRWYGARTMLIEHRNPYSTAVTNEIQLALLGRPLQPGSCQQGFLYPPFLAFTIPHFLLPYRLGLSLWIVTLQVLVVASTWLIARCTRGNGEIGVALVLPLTLAAVTSRYSLLNLGYAQFSILVLFWTVVTWWFWSKGQYLLAGIALTQVASKPQLAFFLIPLWLLLAVARRRWRFVAGFGVTLTILLILPFLFAGNWMPGFVEGLAEALDTCQTPMYKEPGAFIRLGVFIILSGSLLVLAFRSPGRWQGGRVGMLLSLGIAVTLLGTLFTHNYDLVLALLPLVYGIVVLREFRGKAARILEAAFWATIVILPWLLPALVPARELQSLERWLIPSVVLGLLTGLAVIQAKRSSTTNQPTPP
jgi:hypothetical protein